MRRLYFLGERLVNLMSEVILGKLVDESVARRDAVHVAVIAVLAGEALTPGRHVGLIRGQARWTISTLDGTPVLIGVVDPFLASTVHAGERFWLFLYPNTVTSLRHDWTHPAFDHPPVSPSGPPAKASESETWLRAYAEEIGISYGRLMQGAENFLEGGLSYYDGIVLNYDTPDCVYIKRAEFWVHYEVVTGAVVTDYDATFISCAC